MSNLDDVIYEIYEAALCPERWPHALARIGALFNAEGATVIFYSGVSQAEFIHSPELEDAVRVYKDEEWWKQDIHAQRAIESHMSSGDVINDYAIATPEEIETLPIYSDFFRKVGFGWLMSSVMLPDLDMFVGLTVPRAKYKGAYSSAEIDELRLIGRHVEQAMRLSLRIANLDTANESLLAALDDLEVGIYVLDFEGRLIFSNGVGRDQFPRYFSVLNGRVASGQERERSSLQNLIDASRIRGQMESTPQSCVLTGSDNSKIVAWSLPLAKEGKKRMGMQQIAHSIVLTKPMLRKGVIDPVVLRDAFNLSLSEARLAALIGRGMAVSDAASQLNVTQGTARVVLKRVFQKLGINKQTELVLQLSELGNIAQRS